MASGRLLASATVQACPLGGEKAAPLRAIQPHSQCLPANPNPTLPSPNRPIRDLRCVAYAGTCRPTPAKADYDQSGRCAPPSLAVGGPPVRPDPSGSRLGFRRAGFSGVLRRERPAVLVSYRSPKRLTRLPSKAPEATPTGRAALGQDKPLPYD